MPKFLKWNNLRTLYYAAIMAFLSFLKNLSNLITYHIDNLLLIQISLLSCLVSNYSSGNRFLL